MSKNINLVKFKQGPGQRLLTLLLLILLCLARMLGLVQNVCCVKSPMSGLLHSAISSNLGDITVYKLHTLTKIPEVGMQVLE